MGAQDLAMVYPESTSSLPEVHPESTRSLLGDGLEWLKPPKTDLESFILKLALDFIFEPFLDQIWPQMGTPNGRKLMKNRIGFGSLHLNHFLEFFSPKFPQAPTSKCWFLHSFSNEFCVSTLQPLLVFGSFLSTQKWCFSDPQTEKSHSKNVIWNERVFCITFGPLFGPIWTPIRAPLGPQKGTPKLRTSQPWAPWCAAWGRVGEHQEALKLF